MLKALLSASGIPFRRTRDLESLIDTLAESGSPVPDELASLDALTPFASVYRYEDFDASFVFNRSEARELLRILRSWCESQIPPEK